jgi:hypothetical protein
MKHFKTPFQGTNWEKSRNAIRFRDGNKRRIDRNELIASGNQHVIEESKNYQKLNGRTPTRPGTEGWREGVKAATPVQHLPGKSDSPGLGRGKPITY